MYKIINVVTLLVLGAIGWHYVSKYTVKIQNPISVTRDEKNPIKEPIVLKDSEESSDLSSKANSVRALIKEARRLDPDLPEITFTVYKEEDPDYQAHLKQYPAGSLNAQGSAGYAKMCENKIYIHEDYAGDRLTVFHELLHAAYGYGHIEGDFLMGTIHGDATDDQINNRFVKLVKERKRDIMNGRLDLSCDKPTMGD